MTPSILIWYRNKEVGFWVCGSYIYIAAYSSSKGNLPFPSCSGTNEAITQCPHLFGTAHLSTCIHLFMCRNCQEGRLVAALVMLNCRSSINWSSCLNSMSYRPPIYQHRPPVNTPSAGRRRHCWRPRNINQNKLRATCAIELSQGIVYGARWICVKIGNYSYWGLSTKHDHIGMLFDIDMLYCI